jgi:hypothetical protein
MKKVTIFVSKDLKQNLTQNSTWTKAYRVALEFFNDVVIQASSRYDGGWLGKPDAPRHGGDGGGYAKHFCGCHAESQRMTGTFKEAQRVEAHLRFIQIASSPVFLALEFRAYKTGDKEPFNKYTWAFPSENPYHQVASPDAQ